MSWCVSVRIVAVQSGSMSTRARFAAAGMSVITLRGPSLMPDQILIDLLRHHDLQPAYLRRVQQHIRAEVLPALEELARLRAERDAVSAAKPAKRTPEVTA